MHETVGASTRWIRRFDRREATFRLFCLPYAGGGAGVFGTWPRRLPHHIDVCAVELPGRWTRLAEAPSRDLLALADAIVDGVRDALDLPFAIFGHSMGAVLGFEVARRLRAIGAPEPAHLFVSGSRAPQRLERGSLRHTLPDADLLDELRRLSGTGELALDNAELMKTMLPVVRADLQAIETYVYQPGSPLAVPITAFGGLQDEEVTATHLEGWRRETTDRFDLCMLPGGHLFVNSARDRLIALLAAELEATAGSARV